MVKLSTYVMQSGFEHIEGFGSVEDAKISAEVANKQAGGVSLEWLHNGVFACGHDGVSYMIMSN